MSKRILIPIALLMVMSAGLLAQGETFYVAQYAHGGVQFPITTTITIVNLGTGVLNPAQVTIETFDEDGNPSALLALQTLEGLQAVDSAQFEIQGRGVIVVNSHSDNPGVASEGYARITSDDEIAVEVLFSLFDGSGNLLTNTSVLPRPATDQGTVLLKVDTVNGAAGNIALVNPANNGQAAVIAATLRDAFGNDLGDAEINLAAGAKTAAVWTEIFGNLAGANGFAGTVEFTSNVPVIALPLFQTGIELTTQDILPARP